MSRNTPFEIVDMGKKPNFLDSQYEGASELDGGRAEI